jgi:hypothetical protein
MHIDGKEANKFELKRLRKRKDQGELEIMTAVWTTSLQSISQTKKSYPVDLRGVVK